MSKIICDLFEPSSNNDESLNRLTQEFAPLHAKAWHEVKQKSYNRPYDMSVATFATMWLNKTMKIFMAYEDAKPVGYLYGIAFRPLNYQATAFQVEDWFADGNAAVEDELFDYLHGALRMIGCDELLLSTGMTDPLPNVGPGWRRAGEFRQVRFTKE